MIVLTSSYIWQMKYRSLINFFTELERETVDKVSGIPSH